MLKAIERKTRGDRTPRAPKPAVEGFMRVEMEFRQVRFLTEIETIFDDL